MSGWLTVSSLVDESERVKFRPHGTNMSPTMESTMPMEEELCVTSESKGTAKREGGETPALELLKGQPTE